MNETTDRLAWWEEIPLGLALLAQSYVVGLWYYRSISGAAWQFDLLVAVGAGLALDLIVVTTVMGRRAGRSSGWSWLTALGAFGCSALIALDRYGWEWRSGLHIAFPLVVFLYSQHLATPRKRSASAQAETATEALGALPERSRSSIESVPVFSPVEINTGPPVVSPLPSLKQPLSGQGTIYAIEHVISGKVYIGSTWHYEKRKTKHISDLNREKHKNYALQQDWIAEGMSAFSFKVLEVYNGNLPEREQVWINELKAQRGEIAVYNSATAHLRTRNSGKRLGDAVTAPPLEGARFLDVLLAVPLDESASASSAPLEPSATDRAVASAPLEPSATDRAVASAPLELSAYTCDYCQAPLKNKQAVGAMRTNGYCRACKAKRLAAA